MSLTDFLLARIAEDEEMARLRTAIRDALPEHERTAMETVRASMFGGEAWQMPTFAPDPARVLAECEAKRRIVELHHATYGDDFSPQICGTCGSYPNAVDHPCDTLLILAQPYADHPDFDPAWRAEVGA